MRSGAGRACWFGGRVDSQAPLIHAGALGVQNLRRSSNSASLVDFAVAAGPMRPGNELHLESEVLNVEDNDVKPE